MAGYLKGEKQKPFSKGSSKPKEEVSKNKRESLITPQLVYKNGSRPIDVVVVKEAHINNWVFGEYMTPTKEKYNYEFTGSIRLGINNTNGVSYSSHEIRGYFQSNDGNEVEKLFNEISITK